MYAGAKASVFAREAATQLNLLDMSPSRSLPHEAFPQDLTNAKIQLSDASGKNCSLDKIRSNAGAPTRYGSVLSAF
jgi:hypothetical protein